MKTVPVRTFLIVGAACLSVMFATSASSQEAIGDSGPTINYDGCYYYEHSDYGGASRSIPAGTRRKYVGDAWNDEISSFRCGAGCTMTFYEHRDFGGAYDSWGGNVRYVGDAWNDDISSMIVRCY